VDIQSFEAAFAASSVLLRKGQDGVAERFIRTFSDNEFRKQIAKSLHNDTVRTFC